MKSRINLLVKKDTYQYREQVFRVLRRATMGVGSICIVALIFVYTLKLQTESVRQGLLTKKEQYLSELLTKKDVEKKVYYFNQKSATFTTLLKNDVNFLPYYDFLLSRLPVSTASVAIDGIDFDNKKNISFSLNFPSGDELYNALDQLERDDFISIFDSLSVSAISFNTESTTLFTISFTGVMHPIDQ